MTQSPSLLPLALDERGLEATVESENGKRWRLVGPHGRWTMQPEGEITAAEAEQICRGFAAYLSAVPASQATRDAFKAGWWTNASYEQPANYLSDCEEVDWREFQKMGLDPYVSGLISAAREEDASEQQHDFQADGPGIIGSDICTVCGKERADHAAVTEAMVQTACDAAYAAVNKRAGVIFTGMGKRPAPAEMQEWMRDALEAALSAVPASQAVAIEHVLRKFHRDSCYPEAMDFEIRAAADEIDALLATQSQTPAGATIRSDRGDAMEAMPAAGNPPVGMVSPEDEAEHFIREAIDSAPEPLRRLGEYLSEILDEDQWKTADRMLLGAIENPTSAAAVKSLEWRGPLEAFPAIVWDAETPIGDYEIEEVNASDSPAYELRFQHRVVPIAVKDSVDDAKAAAQADFEARIRSALIAQEPAEGAAPDYAALLRDLVNERRVTKIQSEARVKAEARARRMEEALTPFEEVAGEGNEDQPDDTKCTIQAGRSTCYGFTLGDFRRARAALSDSPAPAKPEGAVNAELLAALNALIPELQASLNFLVEQGPPVEWKDDVSRLSQLVEQGNAAIAKAEVALSAPSPREGWTEAQIEEKAHAIAVQLATSGKSGRVHQMAYDAAKAGAKAALSAAPSPQGREGRPANCRNRLQSEGKPYPRSGCAACGMSIRAGMNCPHAARAAPHGTEEGA